VDLYAHLSLADHAVVAGGKLYVNGGGWTWRSPNPIPWAIVLELRVPWNDNNRRFKFRLDLVDGDGQAVDVETPSGSQPLLIEGEGAATAGSGLKPGSPIASTVAVLLPPVALPADELFAWKLTVNGKGRDEWRVSFQTAPAPPQQQAL
jgi:hypothetical protein